MHHQTNPSQKQPDHLQPPFSFLQIIIPSSHLHRYTKHYLLVLPGLPPTPGTQANQNTEYKNIRASSVPIQSYPPLYIHFQSLSCNPCSAFVLYNAVTLILLYSYLHLPLPLPHAHPYPRPLPSQTPTSPLPSAQSAGHPQPSTATSVRGEPSLSSSAALHYPCYR